VWSLLITFLLAATTRQTAGLGAVGEVSFALGNDSVGTIRFVVVPPFLGFVGGMLNVDLRRWVSILAIDVFVVLRGVGGVQHMQSAIGHVLRLFFSSRRRVVVRLGR
jgi:hypothetical protein